MPFSLQIGHEQLFETISYQFMKQSQGLCLLQCYQSNKYMFSWMICCTPTITASEVQLDMSDKKRHTSEQSRKSKEILNFESQNQSSTYQYSSKQKNQEQISRKALHPQLIKDLKGKVIENRKISWRRLVELTKGSLCLQPQLSSIVLLHPADKYILPSLAALASNPQLLKQMLNSESQINENGTYKFKVCNHGQIKQIIIDDYLPVFENNINRTVFCSLSDGLIWVALFVKIFSILKNGYSEIAYGYSHQVLVSFSKVPCLNYFIPISTEIDQSKEMHIWSALQEAKHNKFPVVCGSRSRFTCQGIYPRCSYCFLSCWTENQNGKISKWIKLLNFGQRRNFSSSHCIKIKQYELQMTFSEFILNFQIIDVAHFHSDYQTFIYSNQISKNKPIIYQFQILQATHLYVTFHRKNYNSGKNIIILAQKTINKESPYRYISGKKQQNFADITVNFKDLKIGKYLLYLDSNLTSQIQVRVYSKTEIPLIIFQQESNTFLQDLFYELALRENKAQEPIWLSKQETDWIRYKQLFQELGWAYFIINLGQTSYISCKTNFELDQLKQQGFIIKNKYQEEYEQIIEKGQRQIFIFQYIGNSDQPINFPPKSFHVKTIV